MRKLLVLSVLAAFFGAAPACAQDARVEAAKKEGKVVWYTSLALTSSEKVAKLFETAYPGIKVEVQRTGSQRILQRVMQELQANIKNVDVIHTSDAGHYVLLKEKKLLMKHTPAGIDRFPRASRTRTATTTACAPPSTSSRTTPRRCRRRRRPGRGRTCSTPSGRASS